MIAENEKPPVFGGFLFWVAVKWWPRAPIVRKAGELPFETVLFEAAEPASKYRRVTIAAAAASDYRTRHERFSVLRPGGLRSPSDESVYRSSAPA